ncbi:helix-turn-helix transcriptional regulator [Candidatus Woesebacteria bacterium]|nr:helix-turn-helix transcriptional regulator [Candidatus Woesebacteria bacterium]
MKRLNTKEFVFDVNSYNLEYSNDDLAVELGYMIKNARMIRNMTQVELAHQIGTRQTSIARAERGVSLPSLSFLVKMAKAFHTNLIMPVFEFMRDDPNLLINMHCRSTTVVATYFPPQPVRTLPYPTNQSHTAYKADNSYQYASN